MARYQHGETDALETLVRRYADPLLGFLVRMSADRQQAEDLFQETFLRVHLKAATFRLDGTFKSWLYSIKSWLYSIAAHLAYDHHRRLKRAPDAVSLQAENGPGDRMPDLAPNPADVALQADRRRQVVAALESLPPRQRATLVLAYFEGLSYPEVAAAMRCSVGTVKTQVSRALQTLARLLPRPESATLKGVSP